MHKEPAAACVGAPRPLWEVLPLATAVGPLAYNMWSPWGRPNAQSSPASELLELTCDLGRAQVLMHHCPTPKKLRAPPALEATAGSQFALALKMQLKLLLLWTACNLSCPSVLIRHYPGSHLSEVQSLPLIHSPPWLPYSRMIHTHFYFHSNAYHEAGWDGMGVEVEL